LTRASSDDKLSGEDPSQQQFANEKPYGGEGEYDDDLARAPMRPKSNTMVN